MPSAELTTLAKGLDALGLSLTAEQQHQIIDYLQLLTKWNRVFNLTAVRDMQAMVTQHALDSLAMVPYVDCSPVLDLGSGAGLPGIPLAIALPTCSFVLLDCQQKRTLFLQQTITALGLTNVSVVTARIEEYKTATPYKIITARAVASCTQLVRSSIDLIAADGRWLLLKGNVNPDEYANLPESVRFSRVIPLIVPGLNKQRQLVEICR